MKYECAKTWVEFLIDEENRHIVAPIRCGSWKCEVCAKINASILRRKVREALAAWVEVSGYNAAKFKYWGKFLTLTLPGDEFRSIHSPEEGEQILKKNWRKLKKRLQRVYGSFDFILVDELQPSGYPHLHILLLGAALASKEVLKFIRKYWCVYLGMGNIDLKVVSDLDGAAGYITKYMSKGKVGVTKKGNRVFSFSKGLNEILKAQKDARAVRVTTLRVGFLNGDGSLGKVFWEHGRGVDAPFTVRVERLEELCSYFDGKAIPRGSQESLLVGSSWFSVTRKEGSEFF